MREEAKRYLKNDPTNPYMCDDHEDEYEFKKGEKWLTCLECDHDACYKCADSGSKVVCQKNEHYCQFSEKRQGFYCNYC